MALKLSVIIVNYNVKYYLDQCIRSVLRAFEEMNTPAEIIVVDNHSADGSVDYLEQRYPQKLYPMVRFVRSAHNLGFARANNIAIRQSRGEYVLLLNPDTIVGEDALKASVDFMDAHEDAGAVGVRMLAREGVPWRAEGDCLRRWYRSSRCWASATDGRNHRFRKILHGLSALG